MDDETTPWGGTIWNWLGITKEESEAMEHDFPNMLQAWEQVCSSGETCGRPCSCFKSLVEAAKKDVALARNE